MKTELMPTQVEDVRAIVSGTDIPNFSEPGTGKTLTTIAAIEEAGLYEGIVVCPTVATLMWKRLLARELGANTQHLDTKTTKIDPLADFLIASYGVIEAHQEKLMERNNKAFIIDESHYIKNHEARRTKVLLGEEIDGIGGIYETSQQCWMLTGTPMERYADDLWAQLRCTQPEALAKYHALEREEFQLQFCQMVMKSYADGAVSRLISVGNQSEAILKHMLYKEIGAVRRTMEEVDPFMPPVVEREIFVKHQNLKELSELLKGKTREDIEIALKKNDMHMMTARRLMGLAKLRSSLDYIKMESRNHPVLVGFWHQEVGDTAFAELSKAEYAVSLVAGKTDYKARDRARQRFISGDLNVLLGQIQSMGVAMDGLQEASNHVIMLENDWSASKVEQFYSRLARKGQGMHTQVDFLKCDMGLEDAIDHIRKYKREGAKLIL